MTGKDGRTDRQTFRQTDRRTDRQTDGQTDRQIYKVAEASYYYSYWKYRTIK